MNCLLFQLQWCGTFHHLHCLTIIASVFVILLFVSVLNIAGSSEFVFLIVSDFSCRLLLSDLHYDIEILLFAIGQLFMLKEIWSKKFSMIQ